MARKKQDRPTLHLCLKDGQFPPGARLYLFLAVDALPLGCPIPNPRPGWVGDLVPVAEVYATTAGPLRAYSRKEVCRMTGMSLRAFGRQWKDQKLIARKQRGQTVVTFEDLRDYLRSLPRADGEDVLLVAPETQLDEAC